MDGRQAQALAHAQGPAEVHRLALVHLQQQQRFRLLIQHHRQQQQTLHYSPVPTRHCPQELQQPLLFLLLLLGLHLEEAGDALQTRFRRRLESHLQPQEPSGRRWMVRNHSQGLLLATV